MPINQIISLLKGYSPEKLEGYKNDLEKILEMVKTHDPECIFEDSLVTLINYRIGAIGTTLKELNYPLRKVLEEEEKEGR